MLTTDRSVVAGGKQIRIDGRVLRIARLDAEKYEFADSPDEIVADLRALRLRTDVFTFMQRLRDATPRHSFTLEWDNLAAVPISTYEHWWTKQINNKTRNMVRRAEKSGIGVREVPFTDALAAGIWKIYNEVEVRQGRRFLHYGEDIDAVRRMSATYLHKSVFIGAYVGPDLAGFAKLVFDEQHSQAGLMHILSMVAHRDKAPTNALIAQSIRTCAERGVPYLVYSNFAYGNKQRDSLSDFKEHNGFQKIAVPRYYVPLTRLGAAALRWNLHHGLKDHLPEAILTRARALRTVWHRQASFSLR